MGCLTRVSLSGFAAQLGFADYMSSCLRVVQTSDSASGANQARGPAQRIDSPSGSNDKFYAVQVSADSFSPSLPKKSDTVNKINPRQGKAMGGGASKYCLHFVAAEGQIGLLSQAPLTEQDTCMHLPLFNCSY